MLLVMTVGWGAMRAPAQAPSVIITPSSQQLQRDSSGYVRVRVNNIQHLHAYNVQVSYNPQVVRCRLVRGLDFFGTLTFFASVIDSVNGRTTVNEAVLGPGGYSGSGDLVELRFFGVANGTATLVLTVADFRDTVNQVIAVTKVGAVIQVGPPNSIEEFESGVTKRLHVESYPNPFNPAATVRYWTPEAGEAVIRIHTMLGDEVYYGRRYADSPGTQEFVWSGQDGYGKRVSSGTYVVQVQTGKFSGTTKLLLLR